MPSTFHLVGDAAKVCLLLEESGGDMTEEVDAALQEFLAASEDKLAGIRAYKLRLEATAALYKEEAARFKDAAEKVKVEIGKTNEKALSLLKARHWVGDEEEKHEGAGFTVRINRRDRADLAEGVKLDDLPEELVREKTTRTFDKAAALARLREGQTIPGVERLWGETVVWR